MIVINKKGGIFGFVIVLVLLLLVLWVWSTIIPTALNPSITSTIDATSADPYAGGIEFFLRALPWAVPFILIIGMLWMGATR